VLRVSVIIVGGQAFITASLLALSRDKNIQVIACVTEIADIFGAITETEPTIVLIDFTVVSESQYALLTELRRSHPKTSVIFLCDGADQTKLVDAFRHGASGYLEAKDRDVFLVKAVRAVSNGEAWVPRRFVTKIVERLTETAS
jgi:DNA-binding NarL/FixJ family response regulator